MGNLWLFGGGDQATTLRNDLWRWDGAAAAWTLVKGDATTNLAGQYGSRGQAYALNNPGARHYSFTWRDAAGEHMGLRRIWGTTRPAAWGA